MATFKPSAYQDRSKPGAYQKDSYQGGFYKRGKFWYYQFCFNGRTINKSSRSASLTVARQRKQADLRELELHGVLKPKRIPLFRVAADQWLETKEIRARNTYLLYKNMLKRPKHEFGSRLASDITAKDVNAYQRKRREEVSARTVNLEVTVIGYVLKSLKLWHNLQGDVKLLPERSDVGKALSYEDEERIIEGISKSRSPALYTMFVIAVHTGLRADELRNLRHRDLKLTWSNGDIENGWLTVSKSKTEGGRGRTVPLIKCVCAVLSFWLARFPDSKPEHFVFPAHKVGVSGDDRTVYAYGFNPEHPIGDWGKAWDGACSRATKKLREDSGESAVEIKYRWHDLRHTFITRLLENPAISEQTVMALAGHVSKEMLARYSHIRAAAKLAAVTTLERPEFLAGVFKSSLQSPNRQIEPPQHDAAKYLN